MPAKTWKRSQIADLIEHQIAGMTCKESADCIGMTEQQVRNKRNDLSRNPTRFTDSLIEREYSPEELKLANMRAVKLFRQHHPDRECW